MYAADLIECRKENEMTHMFFIGYLASVRCIPIDVVYSVGIRIMPLTCSIGTLLVRQKHKSKCRTRICMVGVIYQIYLWHMIFRSDSYFNFLLVFNLQHDEKQNLQWPGRKKLVCFIHVSILLNYSYKMLSWVSNLYASIRMLSIK